MPNPLFILYTSGSTGKPKRRAAPPAAIWSAATAFKVSLIITGDIYWCTADVGLVAGLRLSVVWPAGLRRDYLNV